MIEFVLGRYGSDDYRLVKWDGSTETQIGTGWADQPSFEQCINELADHHNVGDTPFSSRDGMVDSHILTNEWPLPIRDMTLDGETLPWNDG